MTKQNVLVPLSVVALAGVVILAGGSVLLSESRAESHAAVPKLESFKPARPMNVVVILCDALRADTVFADRDGQPVMPYLRALAGQSLYFTNAVAPCSWTRPSMASIFTGTSVRTHQTSFNEEINGVIKAHAVPVGLVMLPEYLKKAGYVTVGVMPEGNMSVKFGFGRGFDICHQAPPISGERINDVALKSMALIPNRPYFLYVHYIDTHGPYHPPEKYREWFNKIPVPEAELPLVLDTREYNKDHLAYVLGRKPKPDLPPLSPEAKAAIRALYDGGARYTDDNINHLLASLPDRENTCVVILADHGESFWEHDYVAHALTCYEEVVRVPLLVHYPGIAPETRPDLVEILSVAPTLAAVLGLPTLPAWQGVNLLDPTMTKDRPAFMWTRGPWKDEEVDREMVRDDHMKLIVDRQANTVALFDLQKDPAEQNDIAQSQPQTVKRLKKLLNDHIRKAEAARPTIRENTTDIDPALQQRLNEMGYGRVDAQPKGK